MSKNKPTGYSAIKFFKTKFPQATEDDVWPLIEMLITTSSLLGMYISASGDRDQAQGSTVEQVWDRIERLAFPTSSVNGLLLHYFGVDRKKHPKFAHSELKYAMHDPRVVRLFQKTKT